MVKPYVAPSKHDTDLTDNELIAMLNGIADDYEKQGDHSMANNLRIYLQQRPEYIKLHRGKYAHITQDKIGVIDKTSLDKEDLGFHSKLKGLLLKVGNEIEKEP
jgi:hypothetical protein